MVDPLKKKKKKELDEGHSNGPIREFGEGCKRVNK